MKVTYLLRGFGFTGGLVVLYNFMDNLAERGYDIYAVTPKERIKWRKGMSDQILKRFSQRRVIPLYSQGKSILERHRMANKIVRSVINKPPTDPLDYLKWITSRIINNWQQSDVTIATASFTAYAAYMLADNSFPLYHMQHYEELFHYDNISRRITRMTYYLPITLIANSTWLREQISSRFGRESYLLNPAINTKVFRPYIDINTKYKERTKVRFISYYSPAKFKAWGESVEAMKIVFSELGRDRIEWIVFGGIPPTVPDVPIEFVGKVFGTDLARLYSSAHVVFMNSWYESFPLPPIEAMACGSAVVTTRYGTEDYAFDRKNALVINPREPRKLAKALIELATNFSLAENLALEGLKTAQNFTWGRATDRLEEILRKATSN